MSYDTNNVFAKILRGEIPTQRLYEDDYAIAFNDLHPDAPTHVLVLPKGAYSRYEDFLARGSDAEVNGFFKAVQAVAKQLGLSDYRLITNNGEKAGQSVHHFHMHILGGKPMSKLTAD